MMGAGDFAGRLSSLLEERGVSQLELAARVGVTRAAMSRYVSGAREPRYATLVRIAEELDVQVGDLVAAQGNQIEAVIRLVARTTFTSEQKARLLRAVDGVDAE